VSAYRPDWELLGTSQPTSRTRLFSDGVDGCPERIATADARYTERPDWCAEHGRRIDVEVTP
jgi:hypothetical protein